MIVNSPPPYAVLGYMDPEGGGDYDATTYDYDRKGQLVGNGSGPLRTARTWASLHPGQR